MNKNNRLKTQMFLLKTKPYVSIKCIMLLYKVTTLMKD